MKRSPKLLAVWLAMLMTLTACDFSVYSLPLPGGADVGDDSYAVDVQFRDVMDLVPQSAVKVDEVTVGKVEEVSLQGYTALVTLRVNGDVKLPENTFATIRQTTLLGEKFVALSPPSDQAPTGALTDGDTIPLSRSGRNPEVEEVLGALSLLLNGGGVAQLKTIAQELNKALGGNETEINSVLGQLDRFMGQLDTHKEDIVRAIRAVNALTLQVKSQRTTIIRTLEEMPRALQVLNQQRDGLVKMLRGLKRLSPVATRVIRASKQDTLANLRALDPILTQAANAGDALPRSLQALLTYPFVDGVVGTSPAEAQNLHMGDYTNLSAQLDLDLNNLPEVNVPDLCVVNPDLPICDAPDPCEVTPDLPQCEQVRDCVANPKLPKCLEPVDPICERLPGSPKCLEVVDNVCKRVSGERDCIELVKDVCTRLPNSRDCETIVDTACEAGSLIQLCPEDQPDSTGDGNGGNGGDDNPLERLPDLPGLDDPQRRDDCTGLLCRPGFGPRSSSAPGSPDEDLALLLLQGVSR